MQNNEETPLQPGQFYKHIKSNTVAIYNGEIKPGVGSFLPEYGELKESNHPKEWREATPDEVKWRFGPSEPLEKGNFYKHAKSDFVAIYDGEKEPGVGVFINYEGKTELPTDHKEWYKATNNQIEQRFGTLDPVFETEEKEVSPVGEKFPVNQTKVAGRIKTMVDNDEERRMNAIVECFVDGVPYDVNVLFSGKHYEAFKKEKERFFDNPENFGKKPQINVQGEAFFSKHTIGEITHQRFSVIAASKFEISKTKEEIERFEKVHTAHNPENLQLQIRAKLANDVNLKGDPGKEYGVTSIKHTYMRDNMPNTMYANVVIPQKLISAIKTAEYQKESPILLTCTPKNTRYEKNGETVYSFTLVAKSISHDIAQRVGVDKAKEGIERTAEQINSRTTLEEKSKIVKEEIDRLKSPPKKDTGMSM